MYGFGGAMKHRGARAQVNRRRRIFKLLREVDMLCEGLDAVIAGVLVDIYKAMEETMALEGTKEAWGLGTVRTIEVSAA
jgi:hypothetical protein